MESPQPVVPPLTLSAVKVRYPRLFREYAFLSNREKESMADVGDTDLVVDPATGHCTVISYTDFTKPLEDNGDCPMTTESDANKFCIFLWKLLNVCESGSIGGDACRQFDVLNCALDDTLAMPSAKAKFEHLLGWTAASTNHGLHALLYRGDSDRNRSLFKVAGDEWKKIFHKTANNAVAGINNALRKFAIWMCESFQELLTDAKKEYGDCAKYTFNFIKKPRAKKGPADALPNNSGDTVTKSCVGAKSAEVLRAASASSVFTNKIGGEVKQPTTVNLVVTKPSKDTKLGLGIGQERGSTSVFITTISQTSLFKGTALKVGMIIETINGIRYSSFSHGSSLLKAAEGQLTIVATDPYAIASSAMAAFRGSAESDFATTHCTAAVSPIVENNQMEISVPAAKNLSSESSDSVEPRA